MKKHLSILIVACVMLSFIPNCFAEKIDYNELSSEQKLWLTNNNRKHLITMGLSYYGIGFLFWNEDATVDWQIRTWTAVSTIWFGFGTYFFSKAIMNPDRGPIVTKKGKVHKDKLNRIKYLDLMLSGACIYNVVDTVFIRQNMDSTSKYLQVGFISATAIYSLYNYLTFKPFPESGTEESTILFPLITPKYQGIMIARRF